MEDENLVVYTPHSVSAIKQWSLRFCECSLKARREIDVSGPDGFLILQVFVFLRVMIKCQGIEA